MVKKVFSYDFDEAKRNKNNPPYSMIILDLVLIILLSLILIIFKLLSIDIHLSILLLSMLGILFFFFKFISNFFVCCRRLVSQMSVFAIDKNGDIFKVVKTNCSSKELDDGYSINKLVYGEGYKSLHLGMVLGFFNNIKVSREISNILSTDKVIKTILKNPDKITDGVVYKITKVYNISDEGRYYIIKCDYYNYELDKQVSNGLVKLNKSYKDYQELVHLIKNKIAKDISC